jgi:hypothetical protein
MPLDPEELEDQLEALKAELEAAKNQAAELAVQAESGAQAARELAFKNAGLPDSPTARFFADKYDGEASADAIRQAALEAGILEEAPSPAAQEAAQGQYQMAQMSASGQPGIVPGSEEQMWREFEQALTSGSMNPAMDAQAVLLRYGREAGAEFQMSRSGNAPQTVPMSNPGYSGTPLQ